MGKVIMANVNPSNFAMTALQYVSGTRAHRLVLHTNPGTAGVTSDFNPNGCSSRSRGVFSCVVIRLVAMVM